MLSALIFIVSFIGLLIIGPIIIIGWYAITRGRIEYTATGFPFKTGKIFKGWHFLWTMTKGNNDVYLEGISLRQAMVKIQKEFKVGLKLEGDNFYIIPSSDTVYDHLKERKEWVEEIVKARWVDGGGSYFLLMKSVPKYVFPEWLRDPLSECPTCMASVYGSLIWWVFYAFSSGKMFGWYDGPSIWPALVFWVFYCIGCAFVNTILAKKL